MSRNCPPLHPAYKLKRWANIYDVATHGNGAAAVSYYNCGSNEGPTDRGGNELLWSPRARMGLTAHRAPRMPPCSGVGQSAFRRHPPGAGRPCSGRRGPRLHLWLER